MTVGELERWRIAQQLITAPGDKAEYQAGLRAAEFVKTGEFEGFRLWQDIALKIKQLRQSARGISAGANAPQSPSLRCGDVPTADTVRAHLWITFKKYCLRF